MPLPDLDPRAASETLAAGLSRTLLLFVDELRTVGVPVSVAEALDALRAVDMIGIDDRDTFKAALGATLVKNVGHWAAFETAFDVYFSLAPAESVAGPDTDSDLPPELAVPPPGRGTGAGGTGEIDDLVEALFRALQDADDPRLRALARLAVSEFAGMEPGRPVGGTYYLYRTLRGVELEKILERILARAREEVEARTGAAPTPLEERLMREEIEARMARFKDEVKAEIRRRLVDDRGAEALAKTLRKPLLEEVDFMHATSTEMRDLRRAVAPLARRLAARLARRRRHRRRGRLDIRKTMRESLSSGGVPLDPRFKHPNPHKPEIMLLCDISGSVASFARFTLQFVYAMSMQFSKVRAFVFIDDIDEVTEYFDTDDLGKALADINQKAKVVWIDGHSDYGHAFVRFEEEWGRDVSAKTSIIVTGDARNNYHASEAQVLAELGHTARHVYWLNPEPMSYWDTGDSVMSEYGSHCDGVHEVRNLRQLEDFIETLVESH
ncbi:MAG: VWA domain-containing protein [Acidimicrobiia bacterium]|nr:VWA domain-containing protein [Acidimicrobiia bacterium]